MLAVILGLLLLPCPALSEGLTLKTVSTFAGSDAAADTYTQLLRRWEQETGNRVVDASAPSDEMWKTGVLLDFAAGNEADVLFYFTGTADSAPILRRVVPVRELSAAYPAYAFPEDARCAEKDGQVYAIPVRGYWEGLFCNADLFETYGVALPTTWEALETAIQVFSRNGIVPIAVSLSDVPHYIAEFCILACGDAQSHAARPKAGERVPDSWVDGLRLLRRLYELGAFSADVCSTTESAASRLFTSKQAAMQLDGSWFANGLPRENMATTVVLPFPSHVGGEGALFQGVSMGFYLSRRVWNDEQRRDAAVDLLAYLSTGENGAALGGYTYSGRLKESADQMLLDTPAQIPFQDEMNGDARTLWLSAIPAIAEGTLDPEKLWERVMALKPFE